MGSQAPNLDAAPVSRVLSESGEQEDNGRSEERRGNERRACPVNVFLAPCDASETATDTAFLQARCHDISPDGISFFLPNPPSFQYLVLVRGTPPHQTHVMAEVIHCRPAPDPGGECLVGCRLLGKVSVVEVTDVLPPSDLSRASCQDKNGEEELLDRINELMTRVQGATAAAESSGCRPPASTSRGSPTPAQTAEPQPAEPSVPSQAVDPAPRSVAPETRLAIEAMRQLAKASTRSAISRHTRWQILRAAGDKLLITVIGLLAAAALLWLWGSPGTSDVTGYAVLASFMVATLWGTQFTLLATHFVIDKLAQREQDSRSQ
jgi:hypothetical protein